MSATPTDATGAGGLAASQAGARGARSGGAFWARTALLGGGAVERVRIRHSGGVITAVETGAEAHPGDELLDTVLPGFVNAHSHAFHRALRGRTHDDGGDFWQWRDAMYRLANALDPADYQELATAVYAEMVTNGYTAVGEFHYLHHRVDGTPYPDHDMERGLVAAAASTGIRLTLLDTCYLAGGLGSPLSPQQRRFGDGDAAGWLERWHALRSVLPADVVLGAALHSVRGVPREAIRRIARELPADVPLHIHLSEQPQENADCVAAYGLTPSQVLAEAGLLDRISVVHATHLTDDDIRLLGEAGSTVVMCPSTEADLGDGIGPARALAEAGARIALGSDQHAVIDPLLETRGLEHGERLASRRRGRFTPATLLAAATSTGARSLGRDPRGLTVGAPCDLVELDGASVRTTGSLPAQLLLTATAADVRTVVVAGTVRARSGALADGRSPAALLAAALPSPTPITPTEHRDSAARARGTRS